MTTHTPLSIGALLLLAGTAVATPWFSGVGHVGLDPDGSNLFSRVTGLSDDGAVAVGTSTSPDGQRAVRWTLGAGLDPLATLPGGGIFDTANDVSGDGSLIVGTSPSAVSTGFDIGEATVWTNGTPGAMGFITPTTTGVSNIVATNSDGSVMVGLASSPGAPEFEAAEWTGAGAQSLGAGPGSSATGVSQDGQVIVGSRPGTNGALLGAYAWQRGGGITELQDLAAGGLFDTGATALDVSADGSRIVGWATDTFAQRPVMWDLAGTPTDLGLPVGFDTGLANAISDDASVVVGTASGFTGETAFVWTQATGTIPLAEYLSPFLGGAFDGWTLTSADAISADGLTFARVGINPLGQFEGWVAQIPAPSTGVALCLGVIGSARRRRR